MYKLTENVERYGVIKNGTMFIPNDDSNSDWIEYQKWLDEGNTPEPYIISKEERLNNIKNTFEINSESPVDVLGYTFDGGIDNVLLINRSIQMAQLREDTTVILFDSEDVEHEISLNDAKVITLAINESFENAFNTMKRSRRIEKDKVK